MQRLDAIEETSYLSVPNARVYRKIMRCFYREYEKMRFQLYKEDIFELIRQEEEFRDYTMQELEQDLAALVKWKNLTPIQDPGRVYTIADYKNKQYRYTMSEYAVEIERLTVRLENVFLESGNLSTNYFVRLEKSLEEAETMEQAGLKQVNEWWNLLQEDFRRLNQNYQDYLRDFYSGKADRLMKSVEFVLHKDKFIRYLNEFVQELQQHSRRIAQLLTRSMEGIEGCVLERVVQSELDIPHAVVEFRGGTEPNIREHFRTNAPRESDAVNDSVYQENPAEYLLKPHTRAYREKKDRTGFSDRSLEKMIQRQNYLRHAEQQKEIVMRYIRDQKIVFADITEEITENTRHIFLQWIGQAGLNSEHKGRTEYGQEYRLLRGKGNCVLHCEDGDLTMPAYIMEFQ